MSNDIEIIEKRIRGFELDIKSDKNLNEIYQLLPKGINKDLWVTNTMVYFRDNPDLLSYDPTNIKLEVKKCASYGLMLDSISGEAAILPYKGNLKLSIGYRGLKKLATRSGRVLNVRGYVVRKEDVFEYRKQHGKFIVTHEPDLSESSETIGYYAEATMKNGMTEYEYMSLKAVNEIRDETPNYKYAMREKKGCVWLSHPDAMGKKTVIRRLCMQLCLSDNELAAIVEDDYLDAGIQKKDVNYSHPKANRSKAKTRLNKVSEQFQSSNRESEDETPKNDFEGYTDDYHDPE